MKYSDSKDLFNKLKDKKADLDVKNNIGQTLLMESIKEGLSKKNIINLISSCSKIDEIDKNGNTAAHYCIQYNCNEDIIDALNTAGANFNLPNAAEQTVLQIAKDKPVSTQIIDKLIAAGAKETKEDEEVILLMKINEDPINEDPKA